MRWLSVITCLAVLASACTDEHEVLMKDLNHDSPVVRAGAVRSLSKLGDDEAYMLVSRSLDDRSAIVRIAAVWALHDFKGRDTMAPIIRASRDRDAEVRDAAVRALAKRPGDQSKKALVRVLLSGEPNANVRKLAYASLEEMGLSGERLSGEMAESQLALIRESMAKGSPAERQQAVLHAGRSIHPGGIDLVIEGLADRDQDVVLASLRILDGRGGTAALQKLQLLLADQVEAIRLETIRALPAYGEAGMSLLSSGLRDSAATARLRTLEAFASREVKPPVGLVCPLLQDEDPRVAIAAAGLLRGSDQVCDLARLSEAISGADVQARRHALAVLATIGGEKARAVLRAAMDKLAPTDDVLPLLAALARAGEEQAATLRRLRTELGRALDEVEMLGQSWVGGKLEPMGKEGAEQQEEVDRSRLSDEELNKLYQKYGLGPADADSPRGVSDILAGFDDGDRLVDGGQRLFDPVSGDLTERVMMALDGVLALGAKDAADLVARAMSVPDAQSASRVAAVLNSHGVAIQMTDAQFGQLGQTLGRASGDQVEPLVDLLVRTGDDRALPALIAALADADWEKKKVIAVGLGRLGKSGAVTSLIAMLKGYSAIPAARALAELGQAEAIAPLKRVLESAGPAEEIEILMALARLGCRDMVPSLLQKLDSPDPDVRRSAVFILGMLGGTKEMDALKGLRYDLDRLVRAEVKRVLEETKTGDGSDAWPKTRDKGRSGKPAEEG